MASNDGGDLAPFSLVPPLLAEVGHLMALADVAAINTSSSVEPVHPPPVDLPAPRKRRKKAPPPADALEEVAQKHKLTFRNFKSVVKAIVNDPKTLDFVKSWADEDAWPSFVNTDPEHIQQEFETIEAIDGVGGGDDDDDDNDTNKEQMEASIELTSDAAPAPTFEDEEALYQIFLQAVRGEQDDSKLDDEDEEYRPPMEVAFDPTDFFGGAAYPDIFGMSEADLASSEYDTTITDAAAAATATATSTTATVSNLAQDVPMAEPPTSMRPVASRKPPPPTHFEITEEQLERLQKQLQRHARLLVRTTLVVREFTCFPESLSHKPLLLLKKLGEEQQQLTRTVCHIPHLDVVPMLSAMPRLDLNLTEVARTRIDASSAARRRNFSKTMSMVALTDETVQIMTDKFPKLFETEGMRRRARTLYPDLSMRPRKYLLAEEKLLTLGMTRFGPGRWKEIHHSYLPNKEERQIATKFKNATVHNARPNLIKEFFENALRPLSQSELDVVLSHLPLYNYNLYALWLLNITSRPPFALRRLLPKPTIQKMQQIVAEQRQIYLREHMKRMLGTTTRKYHLRASTKPPSQSSQVGSLVDSAPLDGDGEFDIDQELEGDEDEDDGFEHEEDEDEFEVEEMPSDDSEAEQDNMEDDDEDENDDKEEHDSLSESDEDQPMQ